MFGTEKEIINTSIGTDGIYTETYSNYRAIETNINTKKSSELICDEDWNFIERKVIDDKVLLQKLLEKALNEYEKIKINIGRGK